jgi:AAA+ ATPase superfamily predicted ATPase
MFTLKPVTGKEFIDRRSLIEEMLRELTDLNSTMGFALYGNRRVGKTSVLLEIQRQLNSNENCICIYFSLWETVPSTVEAFIKAFSRCVIEGFRPILPLKYKVNEMAKMPGSVLKKMLKEVKIGAKIRDEIELFISFEGLKDNDYSAMLKRTFELPDKLAKVCGVKCVLMLDEFPSIIDLKIKRRIGEDVFGLIRTVIERHTNCAICISGSIRKTVETSTLLPSSPFYRQFIVREIKSFKKEDVKDLFEIYQKRSATKITNDGIESVFENTAGIPFYIQFIGRKLEMIPKKIDGSMVKGIIDEFLEEEGNVFFSQEFKVLSSKEKKVVIAIAQENHTPKDISLHINETVNTISRYLIYLMDKGIVEKMGKNYIMSDPVFKKWLQKRYDEIQI